MSGHELHVSLRRDSLHTSWGFRLEGGVDYKRSFTVQRVQVCSAAEGQLKPGDMLIAIDGFACRGLTHQSATDMIANAGSTLTLTVIRPGTNAQSYQQSYQVAQRIRMHSQPQQPITPPTAVHRTASDPTEKTPIPRNSALAKMMLASMTDNGDVKQKSGLSGIELLLRHTQPGMNITDYLPQQARRASVSGRATPTLHESSPHYATMRPRTHSHHSHRDSHMRTQLCDSVLRASTPGAGSDSGRSTPQSTAFEFGIHSKPTAVGVWTPPVHTPSARLVHQQYNSPMGLYTPHNVADQIHKQTGTKLSWQKKPPVRFLEDITDSPTYKLLHATEHGTEQLPVIARTRHEQPVTAQSYTFKRLNRQLHTDQQQQQQQPYSQMTQSHHNGYSQF